MKKISKLFVFILSIFVLASCEVQESVYKIDVMLDDNSAFLIEDFSIFDYEVKVYTDDTTFYKVPITSSMLSEDDLNKLQTTGLHEITITYNGQTDVIVIELVDSVPSLSGLFDLTIFELNDTHGYIEQDEQGLGGLSNVARIIEYERNLNELDDVVLMANGDMFQGTAISNMTDGLSVIEAMNEMDFDMMGIGNHEFDWGLEKILRFFDNNEENGEANFPLLNANIYERSSNSLVTKDNGKIFESVIVSKEDVNVGLVSFIGNVSSSISYNYYKPYEIKNDIKERALRICKSLKEQGADVIIVNVHGGESSGVDDYDYNQILASLKYNDEYLVDAIINGHTHTKQKGYIKRNDGADVPVVQSSGNNQSIGKIVLTLDLETMDVVESKIENLSINTNQYDQDVQDVIDFYANKISSEVYCIAGESVTSRAKLGMWVSAVLNEATGADIAIINTGSIRSTGDIQKGNEININTVYAVYPFDNLICLTKVKASEIYNLLNKYEFYYKADKSISSYQNSNEIITVATVDYLYYKSYFPGNDTGFVTDFVIPDMLIRELRLQDTFFPISNPNILIEEYITYGE